LTLSVRAKLFLISIALIAVSMGAADIYLTSAIGRNLTQSIRADLRVRAHLVAREAASSAAPLARDEPSWDVLAHSLGRVVNVRVTLIGADGVVLGDSEVRADELKNLENHASRPEVEQAMATGEGEGERVSATVQEPMLYSAARFERYGAAAGVARVAEPLREVDRARGEVRRIIWIGSALALLLALVLSNAVAKRMSNAVSELTEAARRMSEGDLAVRTRMGGHDELGELGDALDSLAGSLAATLGQLRAERDLQGRILEAMQEGVVVVDRNGRIVLVNPALRSMLLVGAEAVGKLLVETVRHAQLEDLVVEARASSSSVPVEIELPGLKPRRLLVHASPLSGDDEGLLFVFVDVTEVRRLESLRRDFVANASHELRTPIAAVRSATETLRWGALEDSGAAIRFVDIIERNAQRLQSLVEDMLELSKLESNELKLKRERVELGSVVPIVLALFRERAEKKGVRVVAELPLEASAVEGDPRALEHVLSNLVDNAIKYCPPGSRVLVRALPLDEERVKLVVSDTGPGIPAEHLPRLFERFYRVDAGRSRELGGTGLGLSIVKHMVETMRGKVSVESEVGKGSAFTVLLTRARLDG
jgi:two-component system, OmpR family, phosphate regulon sensor histidine kinase PhoR